MKIPECSIIQGGALLAAALARPGDMVLLCLAGICAVTDLMKGKVYNAVTVPGLVAGLIFAADRAGSTGLLEVLCSAGFTLLVLFPFYSAGGLGAGDIKLLAAVSAFMTSEAYLRCFAASFLIGAAGGLAGLILSGGRARTVHFAVPVAAGVILHLAGLY